MNSSATNNPFDVMVIGAGAAGLMAALELAQAGKRTAIIEARDRIGGRILTISDNHFQLPVEGGAEFVHGDLKMWHLLLKKAGAKLYEVAGDIWQNNNGNIEKQQGFIEDYSTLEKKIKKLKHDLPVSEFLQTSLQGQELDELRFSLKNYVEGYYAADTARASTLAMKEELNKSSDKQYRIEGGYGQLIQYLYEQCKNNGVNFILSQPVRKIEWVKDDVQVTTNQQNFTSRKVLITVSIGVLQSGNISFSPEIQQKIVAAKQLGYGAVAKIILQFEDPFWNKREFTHGKDLSRLSFSFSDAVIPTWWTYYPKDVAMITGWSGGPNADRLEDLSDQEILDKALRSLSQIFSISTADLKKKLKASQVFNWSKDPLSFGLILMMW